MTILFCNAQSKSAYKFEKISQKDFTQTAYDIDKSANAVVLADVGSTHFVGNKKGWFTLIFRRRIRIRLLNKQSFDLANFKIPLYNNKKDKETLELLEGFTFNESGGKIEQSELEKKDIFEEKFDKNHTVIRFAMPSVKEGSIIDINYTIKSDFLFNLQPWTFQYLSYPCLWSEYEINVPVLVNYIFLKQGYNKFYLEKRDERRKDYRIFIPHDFQKIGSVDRTISVNAVTVKTRWAMKDLPGLGDADYISTPANYLDKIEFQLAQVAEGDTMRDVMDTWAKVTEELLRDEEFAGALAQDNLWLDKDLESIIDNGDQLSTSKSIYEFVRKNYECTGEGNYIKTKLRDVFKNRKGNAGEINLILIAMLRKKGIETDLILASTRRNGRPFDRYPMVSKYNHAFCRAILSDSTYYLDASRPYLGFGKIDPECYNGTARIINANAQGIDLSPESLVESKKTFVEVTNQSQGVLSANVMRIPGYSDSYNIRKQIGVQGKENFFNDLQSSVPVDSRMVNVKIDFLDSLDKSLKIQFNLISKVQADELIYINPMFGQAYGQNPFKAESRLLPVELNFQEDNNFSLRMEIPAGYKIEELPGSTTIKLNSTDDVMFEYLIQYDEKYITLHTRLRMSRTRFEANEYESLRSFFNQVIIKQKEDIAFRKISDR